MAWVDLYGDEFGRIVILVVLFFGWQVYVSRAIIKKMNAHHILQALNPPTHYRLWRGLKTDCMHETVFWNAGVCTKIRMFERVGASPLYLWQQGAVEGRCRKLAEFLTCLPAPFENPEKLVGPWHRVDGGFRMLSVSGKTLYAEILFNVLAGNLRCKVLGEDGMRQFKSPLSPAATEICEGYLGHVQLLWPGLTLNKADF